MKSFIKKLVLTSLAFSLLGGTLIAQADTNNLSGTADFPPEIHITADGKIKSQGIKAMQFAGTTIFARFIWEEAYLRLTIKTNSKTEITRRYGDAMKLSDIAEGDWLVVEGEMERGSDTLSINATKIKDVSVFTQDDIRLSGTVANIASGGNLLNVYTKTHGTVQFDLDSNTTITKGSLKISSSQIKNGDIISSATGIIDLAKKTFAVRSMEIYVDKTLFTPRNFQGKLKSISGSSLPATMVLEIDGRDITVRLNQKTVLMRANRSSAVLGRFVIGDTIRFYGQITEEDLSVADNVEVVRNVSL